MVQNKWLVWLEGDSFVNMNLPTDPNPRQFLSFANPHYKDMVKTLKSEQHMFSRKNSGGITIFVYSCDSNGDGSDSLTFNKGDGIANDGQTYPALKVHGRVNSLVKVTLEIGLSKDHVGEVASALNFSKKLLKLQSTE
ncbi:AIPR family protein [Bacillus sp. ISL-75]|uniref:AIPR family protein n=1 Tax=Bacillus sp. ISL-75 TaxID=2819137 RepID=UPI001BEC5EE9|nr:AIPR family protein [Bacillus sp. ISL-75]